MLVVTNKSYSGHKSKSDVLVVVFVVWVLVLGGWVVLLDIMTTLATGLTGDEITALKGL